MTKKVLFKITGMHCTSCVMNIDGELEDTEGVRSATTNYAKAQAVVEFDESKLKLDDIVAIIKKAGYDAKALLKKEE